MIIINKINIQNIPIKDVCLVMLVVGIVKPPEDLVFDVDWIDDSIGCCWMTGSQRKRWPGLSGNGDPRSKSKLYLSRCCRWICSICSASQSVLDVSVVEDAAVWNNLRRTDCNWRVSMWWDDDAAVVSVKVVRIWCDVPAISAADVVAAVGIDVVIIMGDDKDVANVVATSSSCSIFSNSSDGNIGIDDDDEDDDRNPVPRRRDWWWWSLLLSPLLLSKDMTRCDLPLWPLLYFDDNDVDDERIDSNMIDDAVRSIDRRE